jgi:hypothetical protein
MKKYRAKITVIEPEDPSWRSFKDYAEFLAFVHARKGGKEMLAKIFSDLHRPQHIEWRASSLTAILIETAMPFKG